MVESIAWEVYSTKRYTYGCKESRLSHRGPDVGNKEDVIILLRYMYTFYIRPIVGILFVY